jgi:DNA-binding GntR family transcriptional regulator
MSDVSVERLAGMVRTEIDQAAAAKDAWAVCEADLMAMYGASHTTVELALCRLTVEGTVTRAGRFWVPVPTMV